jgi:hypothetical protein
MIKAGIIELLEESKWISPMVCSGEKTRRDKDMRLLEEVE